MKIQAHNWSIEVTENEVKVTSSNGKDIEIRNKGSRLILKTDMDYYIDSSVQVPPTFIDTEQTEKVNKDQQAKIIADLHNEQYDSTPLDSYGKELKVGDRIYLEKWQEAVDLTNGGDWSSEYVDINDCFTILEIGNKYTTCDWNVSEEYNILTSELNKFTKI